MYNRCVHVLLWSLCTVRLTPPLMAVPDSNPDFAPISLPPDWDAVCPYTDFCMHKAARPFNYSRTQKPCCDSCSCDPDCGKRKNCCLYSMDKYRLDEKYATRCTWLSTATQQTGNRYTYMTVDTCPDKTSCYDFRDASPWGPMFPVVSKNTGMIYLNELCASCHNDSDIEPFQIEVNCPVSETSMYDSFVSEGLWFALSDKKVINTGCFFRFLSPNGYDLSYHACFENMFFDCVQSDASEEEKALCQSFNATYSYIRRGFANIYCYMCSLRDSMDTYIAYIYVCDNDYNMKAPNIPFSFLLKVDELVDIAREYSEPDTEHKVNGCLKTELMERKTGLCRRFRCPEGQVMLEGRCSFLSKEWTAGPFVSYLRLDPYTPRDRLPVKHLSVLASHKGPFFKTMLKSWSKDMLFHSTSENDSYVSYFVLRLRHKKTTLKPTEFLGSFKHALDSFWKLKIRGKQYRFKAHFNEYYEYYFCSPQTVMVEAGARFQPPQYIKLAADCKNDESGANYIVKLVRKITTVKFLTIQEIAITDCFFCHQVDLKPWEYAEQEYIILVHAINRTLGQAEYRKTIGLDGNVTVSVCMETLGSDFWLTNTAGHGLLRLSWSSSLTVVLCLAALSAIYKP